MHDERPLLVPVYLNQRLVFDLLAMIEGGISTVTAVSESTQSSEETGRKIGTSFGLSDAFSMLLKIDLAGSRSTSKAEQASGTRSEERVHTPASLLYQLRNSLHEAGRVKLPQQGDALVAGDFVEFEASLYRNPLLEAIDGLSKILDMAILFDDKPKPSPQPKAKGSAILSENEKIKAQMEQFALALRQGAFIDMMTSSFGDGIEAVVTLEVASLNDPQMTDLVDGKFKVLGKVIRCIPDKSESIALTRNTALRSLPKRMLENLSIVFDKLVQDHDFVAPTIRWEIQGPAIQVLPIAIFA